MMKARIRAVFGIAISITRAIYVTMDTEIRGQTISGTFDDFEC
jgi:hypothetical protein